MQIRIATRGSELALTQARGVAEQLGAELVTVRTSGDEGSPGTQARDKARFVTEIERALLDGGAELGVHSAKDLPAELEAGLEIVGVPAREDPRDALVGADSLDQLADGARVGTASLRRRSQLLALRPDLEVVDLRGNVDTRLAKVAAGEVDAAVLALAGLRRLGRSDAAGYVFDTAEMTPAAGQGALAIEGRQGDSGPAEAAAALTHLDALIELTAERAAVRALGASCDTPVGVVARRVAGELVMSGYAGLPDGSEWVRDELAGDPEQSVAVGDALAERMLAAGAGDILARAGELR